MAKRKVFFSYDYNKESSKIDEIRAMGIVKDNVPATKEEWKIICDLGDDAIKNWIDNSMADKECVVVFIGETTVNRKWIIYEIEKAWNEKKGILGVYVHNIDMDHKEKKGENPFLRFTMNRDGKNLRDVIKCYDPNPNDAYTCVLENLDIWIDDAMSIREFY